MTSRPASPSTSDKVVSAAITPSRPLMICYLLPAVSITLYPSSLTSILIDPINVRAYGLADCGGGVEHSRSTAADAVRERQPPANSRSPRSEGPPPESLSRSRREEDRAYPRRRPQGGTRGRGGHRVG